MANGKIKGSGYERDISKRLSLFLTDGKEEEAIWRSDNSGGRATVLGRKKKNEYTKKNTGDIKQTFDRGVYSKLDSFFDKYMVETKFYKEIELFPPLTKDLTDHLDQCIRQKENSGNKQIFFVLKRNYRKELLMSDLPIEGLSKQILIWYGEYQFFVYLFQDFFNLSL